MESPRANDAPQPRLPQELLFLIIESLAPSNPDAILPSSHENTKCLLALTRVCRSVSQLASKLLWRSCPHITSLNQAQAFAAALECLSPDDPRRPTSLFLGLCRGDEAAPTANWPWPRHFNEPAPHPGHVSSSDMLDLGFSGSIIGNLVQGILLSLAPTLRRLIVNMPLAAVSSAHDGDSLMRLLRPGFEALVNLEEFTSVGDSFSFRSGSPEVWATCWPKLRRLSLGSPVMNFKLMASHPNLETVVISRHSSFHLLMTGNVKSYLARALNTQRSNSTPDSQAKVPFTLVFVDAFGSSWTDLRPNNVARVLLMDVGNRFADTFSHFNELDRDRKKVLIPRRWIQQHALRGTLWETASAGYDERSDFSLLG
ncbi:hypothetical protein AUP68_16569 [Ilyonectria robusta]